MKTTTTPKKKLRFGDSRDDNGSRPTMPPRTRIGVSHPGGKRYRKTILKLEARQRGCNEARASLGKGPKALPPSCVTMPGSMA